MTRPPASDRRSSRTRHYNPPRCERRRLRLRCAAHGPSRLLRRPVREHEDDRRARRRRRSLRAGDQRRAVDGALDDVDRHRACTRTTTATCTGTRRSTRRSRLPSARSPRTATTSRASSSTRTTSSRTCPRRTSSARRETLDGAFEWLRANAGHAVLPLRPQLGDAHALRHRPRRPQELARREAGGHRGHPVRLGVRARGDARGATGRRSSGSRRCSSPRSSRSSRRSGCARTPSFAFLSDHGESWGERFAREGRRAGRLPHARRDALRRDRRGAADPLGARPARSGGRRHQVRSVDLMPTLLELAGLPARETDGESLLHVDGDRRRDHRGDRHGRAHEARRAQAARGS